MEDEEDEISYSSSCAAEAAAEEAAHMAKFDMVFEPTRLTTMKAMKRQQLLITTKENDGDYEDDDKQLSVGRSVGAVSCCVRPSCSRSRVFGYAHGPGWGRRTRTYLSQKGEEKRRRSKRRRRLQRQLFVDDYRRRRRFLLLLQRPTFNEDM